jgi:hypothetical protein
MGIRKVSFSTGDLVKVNHIGSDTGILLERDVSIPGEPFWHVFHFKTNKKYKVFEKYLLKIENNEKER